MAGKLATLARNLELQHPPKKVAEFLTRCIFTSFAEDVHLLPERGWRNLLESLREDVTNFCPVVEALWQNMNDGGFSPILRSHILKFNGGLFESTKSLPLTCDQLELLIEAADSRWRDVEPAIFGTLLERALDPKERHALGAHYTPRAYVERLIIPTLVEPLRDDWRNALVAISEQVHANDTAGAIETAHSFQRQLCSIRVLDPACGSGNFLYVALEHMKRLEGEVLETLHSLGESQQALEHTGLTVDPHQLLGIELNPRAAVIADLVLWIGYLQWHFRTRGDAQPPIPVISNFHNIAEADALLTWRKRIPALDEAGVPITQWDGITMRKHPATGQQIPDETARRQVFRYIDPKRTQWPKADFIIGNPPFIGARYVRHLLGDGYVDALRNVYEEVPRTCDYVMYWWHKAAEGLGTGTAKRFGFVTTNSISQPYSRGLIGAHLTATKGAIKLVYVIPDQPWVESSDGADVRVAMTVATSVQDQCVPRMATASRAAGRTVDDASSLEVIEREVKRIGADLSPDDGEVERIVGPLESNKLCCFQGVVPAGDGFKLLPSSLLALGLDIRSLPDVVRPYVLGRDIAGLRQEKFIIDLFGLTEQDVRNQFPALYQHLADNVRPFRAENARAVYRDKWWIFAEPRPTLRKALHGLARYIVTPYTAKFRSFVFVDRDVIPDAMAYAIASDDPYILGVLSSKVHLLWALRGGGRMGVGNDPRYISDSVFLTFPFPDCRDSQKQAIRNVAEAIDNHRKRRQQLHPTLTLTAMYNVVEKLSAGDTLSEDDRTIYESGLIGVLRELHEELDRGVCDAYGWASTLNTELILENVVRLNAQRRAEEASGFVRWLRPEFQAPVATPIQATLSGFAPAESPAVSARSNRGRLASRNRFERSRMHFARLHCRLHSRLLPALNRPAELVLQKSSRPSPFLGRRGRWKRTTCCDAKLSPVTWNVTDRRDC